MVEMLNKELGLGEPSQTSAHQSGLRCRRLLEMLLVGVLGRWEYTEMKWKSGRQHWGSALTGQRLIERTKRRGENVENAGLQRDKASFQIFGHGRAISRHRKRVGLEVAD